MSADNGVYILKIGQGTEEEFRVKHMYAAENLTYVKDNKYLDSDTGYNLQEVYNCFSTSPVFTNPDDAMTYAKKILINLFICEYGIQFIRSINKSWKEICEIVDKNNNEKFENNFSKTLDI